MKPRLVYTIEFDNLVFSSLENLAQFLAGHRDIQTPFAMYSVTARVWNRDTRRQLGFVTMMPGGVDIFLSPDVAV